MRIRVGESKLKDDAVRSFCTLSPWPWRWSWHSSLFLRRGALSPLVLAVPFC
jgi:hypothetical protein